MKKTDGLFEMLGFDRADERFELIETETGTPKKWGGWPEHRNEKRTKKQKLARSLDKNERMLKTVFGGEKNKDLVLRRFMIGGRAEALLAYLNGMADEKLISDYIMRPLMATKKNVYAMDTIEAELIEIAETERLSLLDELKRAVLDGKTALIVDGNSSALGVETRGYEKRAVSVSQNERTVKGAQEGFTEDLRVNITLLRRMIRSGDLIADCDFLPGDNNTRLALIYRENVTNSSLVEAVKKRLKSIDTRFIANTGIVEQLIEDDGLFPIPQTLSTEKPDRAAAFLMQGSVAVLADGSPFALILPATLSALLSSPEDDYMRRPLGAIMRFIRYFGIAISIMLPGYFVALTMYHQGLISTEVLSTIIKSREMVFEPLPFEMILLLFVFQLIREAGMRVPGSIGQAIGVIGGLILGQAAVAANLASTVILIVVALSGLGNMCVPDYAAQIAASYFRFALVIAAWLGGLLAFTSAGLLLIAYTANLKSFGLPFLAPFAPKTYKKRPICLRGSIKMHKRADDYLNTEDS